LHQHLKVSWSDIGRWNIFNIKYPAVNNYGDLHPGLYLIFILSISLVITLVGCASPQVSQGHLAVNVTVDGTTREVSLPYGDMVQDALAALEIDPGSLDRVEPPPYTVITDGMTIQVIRIREEFKTEQVTIPYTHQELKSETMSLGDSRLIQPGVNGKKELTYRILYENGVETIRSIVKDAIISPAIPEIIMLGIQTPFAPLSIPGKLAFLSAGNAWVMTGSSAYRRPLITSGDLDGRIFTLSPLGDWLLFTRKSTKASDQEINSLWVVSTETESPVPVDLQVSNIVHFADWVPGSPGLIAYSTVQPQSAAPKWQANNDLYTLNFDKAGPTGEPKLILSANSGGAYSWWGTNFSWSPDGNYLAYTRPDGIGLVDLEKGNFLPLVDITPYQTHRDWAWIPAVSWSSDSSNLYFNTHAPSENLVSDEESPLFNLAVFSMITGTSITLVEKTGIFTYPSCSPRFNSTMDEGSKVAYLQSIFPDQSETSRYQLVLMDRDGSNRKTIFPPEGFTGIEPQFPVWAPDTNVVSARFIAILYQGNIWLIDILGDVVQQVTGDGLIERVDWK
jgi:hypothetical protein